MCGIAGIANLAGIDRDAVAPRLGNALIRLAPRGPDGQGNWTGGRVAFAHTRLAIVDLSPSGAQPMHLRDKDGDLTITYNGMIYNFREVREELVAAGHRFETDNDTEVLLVGWRAWGAALLPKLTGMFAFAIWDEREGTLTLARDRFGQKPLIYHQDGGQLAFASDLIALQQMVGTRGSVNTTALRLYFALRFLPEPWCIMEGAAKLPAGHVATFGADGLRIERWYDLAAARPARYLDPADARADLARHFDDAVRDRLVADVPVGAFLSGGIDSAIVASSMARVSNRVRTFTIGVEGAGDYYEERPMARQVADHIGAEHTEIPVSAADAPALLADVFDGLDEPFGDSSAIPTFLVARVTRQYVTSALSGDGADEVFAGYRRYQGELRAGSYQRLPAWLRRGLIEPAVLALPEGKSSKALEAARRLRRFAAHAGKPPVERQAGWARQLSDHDLDRLLVVPAAGPNVEALIGGLRDDARDEDSINAMLHADIHSILPGDMLVKVDRMSMANALEVRCPWLDQRVVETAAAMPGDWKLRKGRGKAVLRDTFADRLPAEVFDRPKRGFEVPVADWLTGRLADTVRRAIDPAFLRRQGLIQPELPAHWFEQLKSGKRDTSWELWSVVAFQAWAERQTPDALVG